MRNHLDQSMDTFIKFLMGGVASLILITIVLSFTGFHYIEGQGEHTGYITAVSTHGVIWKTTSAYVKTDTQSSQEDEYCVIDKDLINNLKQVSESHKKVTLYFTNYLFTSISECSGGLETITGIGTN